jgi:prepilin-type N-terminal cleavage/methylation domain-containing protein
MYTKGKKQNTKKRWGQIGGFTLIELVVVMGIVTLISSIILAKHSNFGGKVLLRSLAYEIALSIRETQTFGISSKQFGGSGVGYRAGYGVHFDRNTPNSYIQFSDSVHTNSVYDGSGELVRSFSVSPKYKIKDLCAKPVGGSLTCGQSTIDVSFVRPHPDAAIRVNNDTVTRYEEAQIMLTTRNEDGDTRAVIVGLAGQIAVVKITTP